MRLQLITWVRFCSLGRRGFCKQRHSQCAIKLLNPAQPTPEALTCQVLEYLSLSHKHPSHHPSSSTEISDTTSANEISDFRYTFLAPISVFRDALVFYGYLSHVLGRTIRTLLYSALTRLRLSYTGTVLPDPRLSLILSIPRGPA